MYVVLESTNLPLAILFSSPSLRSSSLSSSASVPHEIFVSLANEDACESRRLLRTLGEESLLPDVCERPLFSLLITASSP